MGGFLQNRELAGQRFDRLPRGPAGPERQGTNRHATRQPRQGETDFQNNPELRHFLFELFQFSGLFGNIDIQGAWTLKLLSSNVGEGVGPTWFTLNIGTHAVAYTARKPVGDKFRHCMSVDRLILDFPETIIWIEKHNGEVREAPYRSAKRAVEIKFDADFAHATKLFKLPGLRRALIAYWSETLADMRERNAKSTYAGFHCSDAVDALLDYKRATEKTPPSR